MLRNLCQPIRVLVPDQLQPLPRKPRPGPRGLAELPRASQHLQGSVVTNHSNYSNAIRIALFSFCSFFLKLNIFSIQHLTHYQKVNIFGIRLNIIIFVTTMLQAHLPAPSRPGTYHPAPGQVSFNKSEASVS